MDKEVNSRSRQRRIAVQKGEPMPTFDSTPSPVAPEPKWGIITDSKGENGVPFIDYGDGMSGAYRKPAQSVAPLTDEEIRVIKLSEDEQDEISEQATIGVSPDDHEGYRFNLGKLVQERLMQKTAQTQAEQTATAYKAHYDPIVEGLRAENARLKWDCEALSRILHDKYGMGQGEIDSEAEDMKALLKNQYKEKGK